MKRLSISSSLFLLASLAGSPVAAQPSPAQQQRIDQAIKNASTHPVSDWTAFVSPFIGTDNDGDVCPGASVPFGMVKIVTDNTGYAPAGYVVDNTQFIRGISPLHDSGTGSSLGSYGNFEVMPMTCSGGFDTCNTILSRRQVLRKKFTDDASPGYFTQTLANNIKLEATTTRRAGLERFTFPKNAGKPYLVIDLSNDLPASFHGGNLTIDPQAGRVMLGGLWQSSFGPPSFTYQAFACYDLLNGGSQKLDEYGVWTANNFNLDAKGQGETHLNFTYGLYGGQPIQSGALVSFASNPSEVTIRVGVSFISAEQACSNAESEVGASTFEQIQQASQALWNEKLSRVQIDVANTKPNITQMLYSSLYRSFLTPNNATGEGQGQFENTDSPYFDSMYTSWDTFRTFYPLLALTSPVEYGEIVENYIDAWRKTGFVPEARCNNLPGWTQGGSNGVNILADFAVKYHNEAAKLGVDVNELYAAIKSDGMINAPEFDVHGRQLNIYRKYGYLPTSALDTSSTGRVTREASRTLEYAFNDFAIRQVAQLLGQSSDEALFANYSFNYRNVFDSKFTAQGFTGFTQKRFPNGTFQTMDPTDCSPVDKNQSRSCSLQQDNVVGFFESSSWEYSFFAPHDTAELINLMGGNDTFVKRLDAFFKNGYFNVGNEPSFQTPLGYHYANQPTRSVDRVRQVVFQNFGPDPAGLPGNDDQAAMATLLVFHILGLYPVPTTTQYLVVSPFVPSYTLHNAYLGTTTNVTVVGFDPKSVAETIPSGARAYVKSVTVNGNQTESICHFDFYDTFRLGGNITIEVTNKTGAAVGCAGSVPESLSAGGFTSAR